jgi:glycosyltransferase involved in cell wall biosynthesis
MPDSEKSRPVFREPWNDSLAERLGTLAHSDFRILYFYEHPDSASFRYRCYNMAQAITSSEQSIAGTYIFLSDLEALANPSDFADVLVVCRARYDSHVERLISSFKNVNKKVFFDIDDLIFDVSYAPLVASNLNFDLWGEGLDKWFSLVSRMGATMKLCDEVITTNSYLSGLAHQFSGLPSHVIPNFLNREQLAVSETLYAQKNSRFSGHEKLRLGYFSGSKSHTKDFEVVVDAITENFGTFENLELLIVGHLDLPSSFEKFTDRVSYRSFTDFVGLQTLIAGVDLCLAPLQESVFTYSKSQLKFFEAGIVGVPTMATPIPAFHEAINAPVNGFLSAAGEWHSNLFDAISLGSRELRLVGERARESAHENFSPLAHQEDIVKTLRDS